MHMWGWLPPRPDTIKSLPDQIGSLEFMRGFFEDKLRGMVEVQACTPHQAQHYLECLDATRVTLQWLRKNEARIKGRVEA